MKFKPLITLLTTQVLANQTQHTSPKIVTNIDNLSTNWARYLIPSPPTNQTFIQTSITIHVPIIILPVSPNPNITHTFSLWIGIDGYSKSAPNLLQAGLAFDLFPDGSQTAHAWYERLPSPSIGIDRSLFSFTTGDLVRIISLNLRLHNSTYRLR